MATRRLGATLLSGLLALACGASDPPKPVAQLRARRAVLVSIDTLRADRLGAVVEGQPVMPHLEAFAARGVRFATAISPAPLTLVSHATLLTGLDPPHHGVRDNGLFELPEDVTTLAERLHAAGLATGAVVGAAVLDRSYGLARGFDLYDDVMGTRRSHGTGGFAERRADRVVERALDWLAANPDPFFLWVHVYDPHVRYAAPRDQRALFPRHPYDAEVHYADQEVGRLLEVVERRWPDGRTLFVVTSDHGESLGEHGEPTHSYSLYDATQHVPLVMVGPGLPEGAVVDGVVRLADVAPTVLAALGIPPAPGLDGRDLTPLATGTVEPERVACFETLATRLDYGWSPLFGVRTAHYAYIRAPRPELYDIVKDPGEHLDLAARLPEVTARLDAVVEAEQRDGRPLKGRVHADVERRAQLLSLGYVLPGEGEELPADATAVGGIDPKDAVPLLANLSEALLLERQGDYEDALEHVQRIPGEGSQLLVHRARLAREAGHLELAEELSREAVAHTPGWADAHLELALVLAAQGRDDAAGPPLEEATRLAPGESRTWLARAVLALRAGDLAGAQDLLERAHAARDRSDEVCWRLASLYLAEDRVEEADALLAELPPALLSSPEVVQNLMAGDERAGHPERARARVRRALHARPRSAALHQLLAEVERRGGS